MFVEIVWELLQKALAGEIELEGPGGNAPADFKCTGRYRKHSHAGTNPAQEN